MTTKIIGTGSYLPEHVVSNDDLAKLVDTSDEWIASRTGIRNRRIATKESGADMAAQVNAQVDQVNGEIAQRNDQLSSSAASANSQIDAAVTAVNEAAASGAIDGDQAAEIIGGLEASSVSVEGVGSVDQVAAPDNTSVSISMPEEDANI